ncbi:MAG TPA: hypothetical protein VGJ33_00310 [Candidatus Angelobacter sp.]
MELLDRYLQAVRFWLPTGQQTDIIAELSDDLRSQIEDRESELGHSLNEDEMVALLQQTGHPMRVAGRYQPQQSLIGPALFPLYRFVLKIVAFGYLAPWILVWICLMLFSPAYRAQHSGLALLGTWATFWSLAFSLFGVITIVFAILERFQMNIPWLNRWDPRKLPHVVQRKQRVSRVESIFGLVFSIIFIVWWLGLPRYGDALFGPAATILWQGPAFLWLNPALRAYFLPVLVPTAIMIAQQCINIVRPQWTWLRASSLLVADAISLGIVTSVARIHPYVLFAETGKDAAQHAQVALILNQVIMWSIIGAAVGIGIALLVHAFQTVQTVRRIIGSPRGSASSQISQAL